jgi:hypothetical protein
MQRSSRAREREHRSVPLRIDDAAAVRGRRLFDDCVVAAEEVEPGMVTEAADQDS